MCAYKTSGDDRRYGRRPSSSSIDVEVMSMSSLSREDVDFDVVVVIDIIVTTHGRCDVVTT